MVTGRVAGYPRGTASIGESFVDAGQEAFFEFWANEVRGKAG
jgi:hypothetical protein